MTRQLEQSLRSFRASLAGGGTHAEGYVGQQLLLHTSLLMEQCARGEFTSSSILSVTHSLARLQEVCGFGPFVR
jgi:hypothetical protein